MPSIVERWSAAYFGGRLSPEVVTALRPLDSASGEAQAFVDRAFRLMRVARFEAADVSAFVAWQFAVIVPKLLPGAWGGLVPPITTAGRHRKLDEYIAANPWHRPGRDPVLLDMGCGFPPVTAIETAARLADWQVVGADPTLGRYLLYDDQGAYACFDDRERLHYYQAATPDPSTWDALHRDPGATRARFRRLLEQLLPELPAENGGGVREVERDGARLVLDPARRYETENLRLVLGGIGSLELDGGADVIRCMNVLMYFDREFRRESLAWAARNLRPGGLFLCGTNSPHSTGFRYTLYQEQYGRLRPREFALSLESVRSVDLSPWYALQDDDHEALQLAHALAVIRNDSAFCRTLDGQLETLPAGIEPADIPARLSAMAERLEREDLVNGAAEALRRSGRKAWRNAVGHVAMEPAEPASLAASPVL
jgi:SAM-dependent methyltransferase